MILSENESFHCLLCRGVVSSSDLNLRYKDHLKREHKVYFYTNWIIEKTTSEEKNITINDELQTESVSKVKNVKMSHSKLKREKLLESPMQTKNAVLLQPLVQPKREKIESSIQEILSKSSILPKGVMLVGSTMQPKTENFLENTIQPKRKMLELESSIQLKRKVSIQPKRVMLNSSISCEPVSLKFDLKKEIGTALEAISMKSSEDMTENKIRSGHNSDKDSDSSSDNEETSNDNLVNSINNFNFSMNTTGAENDEEQVNNMAENETISTDNSVNDSNNRINDEVRDLDNFISTITNDVSTDFNFVGSNSIIDITNTEDNEEQLLDENNDEQVTNENDDQSLNEEYYNDSTSEVLKPSLLITTTSDGKKIYSCSYCPDKTFPSKNKGKRHVIRVKSHDITKFGINISTNASTDLNGDNTNETLETGSNGEYFNDSTSKVLKLCLLIKRASDGTRIYICSYCPSRTFQSKSKGMRHIAQVKSHDLTESVVDPSMNVSANLNDENSDETTESTSEDNFEEQLLNEEQSSVPNSERRPKLVIKKSDGKKVYGCTFCPGRTYPTKWKGKKHVTKAKFHDFNPSTDPSRPTVLITRGLDGKRIIGCSVCPKVFKDRKLANNHVLSRKHRSLKVESVLAEQEPGSKMVKIVDARIVNNEPVKDPNPFIVTTTEASGEKVYSCSMCPHKQHKVKQMAKRHLERHKPKEERRKYQCSKCTKKFITRQSIRKHGSLCQGLNSTISL